MSVDLKELLLDIREQVAYMGELGVERLDVRLEKMPSSHRSPMVNERSVSFDRSGADSGRILTNPSPQISNLKSEISDRPAAPRSPGESRLASLPSLTKRPVSPVSRQPEKDETLFGDIAPALPEPIETIDQIRGEIGNCTRCPLHAGRTQIVHSTGNRNADLMFVGEAPGADEDEQGFPFVGRAGKLLTDIIVAIGFSRESVFIGNINRCRPPGNRAPVPEETAACRPFLLREVAVVRPKVIVVLGNTATQNLLDIKTPISKLRGNFQEYFGVKVMPTFHPAYLLRDPHKKREVWEDMKKVRDYLSSL